MSWQDTQKAWEAEELTDGEALDDFLDILPSIDPCLVTYVKDSDGDELTDAEAIELILCRLEQL